jgi:hypothetical protein
LKTPPTIEQVARASATNAIFKLLRHEFENDHGIKGRYSFDELKADVDFRLPKPEKSGGGTPKPGEKSPNEAPKTRLLLRRSLDKAPLLFDTDKSGAAMAQDAEKLAGEGALFSYGHAFSTGADEWLAQGVFAYEIPFDGGLFGKTSIGRWLPSLEFSRVDFAGNGKPKDASPQFKNEDNVANFRVSYEGLLNWPQGVAGFTGSSLRLTALWKTDWDFQSQIPTAEAEWTFYNGRFGLGSFDTITSDYIWFRFDATVHGDAGYVLEDGKWTKSNKGDTFAHLGPRIGVALIPFPKVSALRDNPIVLSTSVGEFFDLTKQSKEIRAVTADVSWYLRKPGSGSLGPIDPGVALTLAFRNYRNVENQTNDNSILLGIAVGF